MKSQSVIALAGPLRRVVAWTLTATTPMPAPQPLVHVPVHTVERPFGIAGAEVVAPPPQHRVKRCNHVLHIPCPAMTRIGQLVYAVPQPFHRSRRGPALHE